MNIITYQFADGTISEVIVSDELYAVHEELVKKEKRNHWKNTRRHISLDYLNKHEIDIEAENSDPLTGVIRSEEELRLHEVISLLSKPQRELVKKVFFDGLTTIEIAKSEGVSQSAISHRLATVYKKLKKLF